MAERFYRQTEEAWRETQAHDFPGMWDESDLGGGWADNSAPSAGGDVAQALLIAADILEKAHREGLEVEVPWWWLRDRADEAHVATDPACVLHVPPSMPDQRQEFDDRRGFFCGTCVRIIRPAGGAS